MMKIILLYIFLSLSYIGFSQDYESYFLGNSNNISPVPNFGICLMGGAQENDQAMQWFLEKANGGDVVVLRTSGSDGYNNYFLNELNVDINSVETLVINNQAGAANSYVLDKVANAEAIWFAGGDQATYVNFFKDNALNDLLNAHVNIKQAPIGGTSAGMAIMGEFYFDALNGSVTSTEALNNPFGSSVSIGQGNFLNLPFLGNLITDTHYDNPDRKGRHLAFLSRIVDETGERAFGIAAEEFVGICIGADGVAQIYGEFPEFEDYAYFLQVNCIANFEPETLENQTPLTWNLNNEAIKVYKVAGTETGSNSFNLNDWESGNGGEWQNWWVEDGSLFSNSAEALECENLNATSFKEISFKIYPNPVSTKLYIETSNLLDINSIQVFDVNGKSLLNEYDSNTNFLDVSPLKSGVYFVKIETNSGNYFQKIIKR